VPACLPQAWSDSILRAPDALAKPNFPGHIMAIRGGRERLWVRMCVVAPPRSANAFRGLRTIGFGDQRLLP
jgi:hypothetical protein